MLRSKKEFDSKSIYSKNVLKTKIKPHADEIIDFYDKKFLKWSLIILV